MKKFILFVLLTIGVNIYPNFDSPLIAIYEGDGYEEEDDFEEAVKIASEKLEEYQRLQDEENDL